MKCSHSQKLIRYYIDHKINPNDDSELLSHLEGCETCRQELKFYREYKQLVSEQTQAELPSDFMHSLQSRLDSIDKTPSLSARLSEYLKKMLNPAAHNIPLEAAGLLLSVTLALVIFKPFTSRDPLKHRTQLPVIEENRAGKDLQEEIEEKEKKADAHIREEAVTSTEAPRADQAPSVSGKVENVEDNRESYGSVSESETEQALPAKISPPDVITIAVNLHEALNKTRSRMGGYSADSSESVSKDETYPEEDSAFSVAAEAPSVQAVDEEEEQFSESDLEEETVDERTEDRSSEEGAGAASRIADVAIIITNIVEFSGGEVIEEDYSEDSVSILAELPASKYRDFIDELLARQLINTPPSTAVSDSSEIVQVLLILQ